MKEPQDGWDRDEREMLDAVEDELERVRARHASDPPVDVLRAARGNALPEDVQAEATRHLAESSWSRALVDGLETAETSWGDEDEARMLARVRRDTQPLAKGNVAWGWLWNPAFGTAALAAVLLVAWVSWRSMLPEPPPPQPGPAPPAATPPAAPAFQLPLEKPDIKLSVAALTWRGSGPNQFLADLKPALDAFRAEDFQRADREFSTLSARYPESIEVLFYQGVARLFLGDSEGASERLARAEAVADRSFAADVEWYRAVAEHRRGNLVGARTRLESLCRGSSARAAAACDALKKLQPHPVEQR